MTHDPIRHERLIRQILAMTGDEIETDRGRALCAEALSCAPLEIQTEMTRYMKEIGLLPKVPDCVDDQGNGYYTVEQLAESTGTPTEEVRRKVAAMVAERPDLCAAPGTHLNRIH